jgi:hypothetical protein
MIVITGEVRKLLESSYKDRNGETRQQFKLIMEPDNAPQNYEIELNTRQCEDGAATAWQKLKGKSASLAVSLYVNHEHRFYKFRAAGQGLPITK